MSRLKALGRCPFCGKKEARRKAWGEGFAAEVNVYVGQVQCSCGGMMEKRVKADSARDGYHLAKEAATDAWNRRDGEK